jgi:hypothetical protein
VQDRIVDRAAVLTDRVAKEKGPFEIAGVGPHVVERGDPGDGDKLLRDLEILHLAAKILVARQHPPSEPVVVGNLCRGLR